MGLVPAITTEFILSRLDEAQIFSAYFEPVSLKKIYSSPFRRDRNPSCSFYYNSKGRLIFHDFGKDEHLDCFAFVSKKEMMDLPATCKRIAADFGLIRGMAPVFKASAIQKTEDVVDKIKKETIIEYKRGEWTERDLDYWNRYEITEAELRRELVSPVHGLRINDKALPNWRQDLRFGYDIVLPDRVYTKLYTPLADKDYFKWVSNIPLHIPFGINMLPKKSNILIVSKAQKERILFQKFFSDVIATQNESKGALNEKTAAFIRKHYDTVFIAFDNDERGRDGAAYFEGQYGFIPIFTSDKAKQHKGVKDWADLVENYGLSGMELYLKHLNLL